MSAAGAAAPVFGVRLLLVAGLLLVICAHGLMLALPTWPSLLAAFSLLSVFGIDLLLVLAGFVLADPLHTLLQTRGSVWTFWSGRWRWTWPGYYIFLAVSFALYAWLFQLPAGDASYLWFGQSLLHPAPSAFFAEGWRLAVEEWFFLLLPLLLVSIRSRVRRPERLLVGAVVALIVLLPLLRFVYIQDVHPLWDSGLRKITLLRLDAPAWGLLIGCWVRRGACESKSAARLVLAAAIVLLGCAGFGVLALVPRGATALNGGIDALSGTLLFSALPAGLACLLVPGSRLAQTAHAALTRGVDWIVEHAYALYLVHLPLLFCLLFFGQASLLGRPLWITAAAALWLVGSGLAAALVQRLLIVPLAGVAGPPAAGPDASHDPNR